MALIGFAAQAKLPSPGAAAFIGFVAQAKPARFVSAGAFPFGLNPGDATETEGTGV